VVDVNGNDQVHVLMMVVGASSNMLHGKGEKHKTEIRGKEQGKKQTKNQMRQLRINSNML